MKHSSLLFLCLIFSFWAEAQSKKEQKMLDLVLQKDWVKMEKKASKILQKNRSNSYANYAMAEMNLSKAKSKKTPASQKRYLSKSLRYYKHIPNSQFSELRDSIHFFIREHALDSNLSKDINNQYRHWLLVLFTDSVPEFQVAPVTIKSIAIDSSQISNELRLKLLRTAKKLEGVPYKYAGTDPQKGLDCSGFTQYVYKSIGIEIPHNSSMQSKLSENRIPLNQLQPGDLIFFGGWNGDQPRVGHAGLIFAVNGNNITVIHCVTGGVKIEGKDSSWDRYWVNNVLFGISLDTLANQ